MIDDLRCFREVARALNFRAAARQVALTPAAVSTRVANLESQLGVKLFVRNTRQVQLTREGAALVPYAERTLAAAAECLRVGQGVFQEPPLELTLGTRHELGLSWLLPMRRSLEALRPQLTLHFYFGSGSDLVHRVRGRDVDCAVTSSRIEDPRLTALQLHEERYVFVGKKRDTLIDISEDLPLLRYLPNAAAMRFKHVRHMGTIAAMRALVLAGEGVAVLPEYFVADALKKKRLKRIPGETPTSDFFRLVFRSDDTRRHLYEELAAAMRRVNLR